jgi:hypothetical protein
MHRLLEVRFPHFNLFHAYVGNGNFSKSELEFLSNLWGLGTE